MFNYNKSKSNSTTRLNRKEIDEPRDANEHLSNTAEWKTGFYDVFLNYCLTDTC